MIILLLINCYNLYFRSIFDNYEYYFMTGDLNLLKII